MSGDQAQPGRERAQFTVVERFRLEDVQALMRHETIYWDASDALSPQPSEVDFVSRMVHPQIWTLAACWGSVPVGYVQFARRTAIMAEMFVGFLPQFRGRFAKAAIEWSIYRAFTEKGLTKLVGLIAADNRAALMLARRLGFKTEGRLTKAIVRKDAPHLRDIVVMSLNKHADY